MDGNSIYEKLGIDPHKSSIKQIFGAIIDKDFPNAFCNIIIDPDFPEYALTMHGDGDGSKYIQRILHYKETGDPTILQYAADDGVSMNFGDISASGFVSGLTIIIQYLNVNRFNVPKDTVSQQIALRVAYLKELYGRYGLRFKFLGGETADLPDQLKSLVYDACIFGRTRKENIIAGNVQAKDLIFGMASDGKGFWEERTNSGIMSNGLTMARIVLMNKEYSQKYPELCREDEPYRGKFLVNDKAPDFLGDMTISEAILSPTRQWAIVIKMIIDELKEKDAVHLLHGITMNTGGGATKILNIGKNISYQKEMPSPPGLFQLIQSETGENWKNMFKSFNCGVGLDIVGSPEKYILQDAIHKVSKATGIDYYNLGFCSDNNGSNEVKLYTKYGDFTYRE